jgi:hypothetical protein
MNTDKDTKNNIETLTFIYSNLIKITASSDNNTKNIKPQELIEQLLNLHIANKIKKTYPELLF